MLMHKWRCLLIAVCMISCSMPAMAARLAGSGSDTNSPPGWVISHINIRERTIVINDATYKFAAAVRVHTTANKQGSLGDLRRGMRVGYRLKDNGAGQAVISEIWESGLGR